MKRLLVSSKFWLIVIGSAATLATYELASGDNLVLALTVGGAFTSGVIGTTFEDYAAKKK